MTSNDYYDTSNYATRLIGDNLVIYTPFEVSDMARQTFRWPVVRRWRSDDEPDVDADRRSRPLFDAAQIYRPVRASDDPTVHSVSVCPLGPVGGDRNLECRTTAFVGPNRSQWYVTESDAYVWTVSRQNYSFDPQACDVPASFENNSEPSLLYRVPVEGGAPGLIGARGVPPDQFSLQASGGRFQPCSRTANVTAMTSPIRRRGSPISISRCRASILPSLTSIRPATRGCPGSNRIISPIGSPMPSSSMAA